MSRWLGVVYNAFKDPVHSLFYVLAMLCLGFHLTHGIQSFFQTYGLTNTSNQNAIKCISNFSGYFIALAYSSIPIYVLWSLCMGPTK